MHMAFLSRGFKNLQWYGMTHAGRKARFFLEKDVPFYRGHFIFRQPCDIIHKMTGE